MHRLARYFQWIAIAFALVASSPTLFGAAPVIRSIVTGPSLAIESDPGTSNQIQFSPSLNPASWQVLTNVLVTNSPLWITDASAAPAPQRFYRLLQLPTNNPNAAVLVTVAGFPSPQTAGVAGGFTVTARTSSGGVATGYRGTIHFTCTDGAATLPADYTFTAGDAGTHTFTATLRTAGTRAITAADTVTATIAGTQSNIIVNPGTATALVVTGYPSPQTAGVAGSFTVRARDAFGNTATSYTGTVTFTSTDPAATLPANTTFVEADAGVKSFAATMRTAGTRAITATDTVAPAITGTQNNIVVAPGAAATYVVAGFPSPQTAGVAGSFTVTARDAFGNVATGYAGTVTFTSTDPAATLPANTAFVAADAGVKAFTATMRTAGTRAITATDTVVAAITGTQSGIVVNPGPAKTLVVSGYPSPQITGVSGLFTVTARDIFGNTATGYTGTVAFTSTDPLVRMPANATYTAANAGVRSFSVALRTIGIQSITATDTLDATITGTQSGISITP